MPHSNSAAKPNRLAREISPYLLLHRHNPVDWYPWGEEALRRARDEDKPIFLSVGYSTCYWCHVMERESFADAAVAALMNEHFVNVKLDREERPDIDEIYMAATQIYTQQGGWPNSVFLTPELGPFFAGTYFPPEGRQGLPSFRQVLESMAHAWEHRRDEVFQQAEELTAVMRRFLEERGTPAKEPPPPAVAEASLEALAGGFDAEHGGFGGAPKFPSPGNLFLLEDFAGERPESARMLEATLDRMARGGLYDQLAGGFHRYATDRQWKVPHFEKMLYDNGLMLELYARWYERTGEVEAARVTRRTAAFLEREMSAPEGGFWSAIDAETDGHEGAYYVWTIDELTQVLGPEDAGFLATLYGYDRGPFFEREHYVLHLPLPLAEQAAHRRMSRGELLRQMEPLRERLLAARGERPRPATDDKVLTDWNGMAIAGVAEAGRVLEEPALVERAARAAGFVLAQLRSEQGTLLHSWRQGEATIDAFLADYVFLVRGLLALHTASGEASWLAAAVELTDEQVERLADPRGGFFTAGAAPDVLFRSKEIFDGALPATNAVAVLNLLDLVERTAEGRFLELARSTLCALAGSVENQPEGARMLTLAARRYHALRQSAGESSKRPADAASPSAAASVDEKVVTASLELAPADGDGWQPFRLRLAIAAGWHLYAHEAGEEVAPTELAAADAELRFVTFPPGTALAGDAGAPPVYEGDVEIAGQLRPAGEAPSLALAYQACDERRCLAPSRLTVEIASSRL